MLTCQSRPTSDRLVLRLRRLTGSTSTCLRAGRARLPAATLTTNASTAGGHQPSRTWSPKVARPTAAGMTVESSTTGAVAAVTEARFIAAE